MTPEAAEAGPPSHGWPEEEVRITTLPGGWRYRIDTADGAATLVGLRLRHDAEPPPQIRRRISRALGGTDAE